MDSSFDLTVGVSDEVELLCLSPAMVYHGFVKWLVSVVVNFLD